MKSEERIDLAQALAFAGNSLLKPMNQTSAIGLDADFWERFPRFSSTEVELACKELASCGERIKAQALERGVVAADIAGIEFTKLFVGPPAPAAAPWETFYRNKGPAEQDRVGYGTPAVEMRKLLAAAGLKVDGPNNQYPDHIGIELLYASTLLAQEGVGAPEVASFVEDHPLGWINDLQSKVNKAEPLGYVSCILALSEALLTVAAVQR